MIASFSSLSVLHDPHVVLCLAAPLLALAGVAAIARERVFNGAALSYSAALGVVAAMSVPAFFGMHHVAGLSHDALKTIFAIGCTTGAALIVGAAAARREERANVVLVTIVLGAVSASGLLATGRERAATELREMLVSAVLTATPLYVIGLAVTLCAALALVISSRRKLVLLTVDPAMAEAVGMRVAIWMVALALGVGAAVGFSLRAAGLLYTFGCLVLAPLAARGACREIGCMYWVAPVIAFASALIGALAASRHDLPPAQLVVLAQCVLLVPAWSLGRFLGRNDG